MTKVYIVTKNNGSSNEIDCVLSDKDKSIEYTGVQNYIDEEIKYSVLEFELDNLNKATSNLVHASFKKKINEDMQSEFKEFETICDKRLNICNIFIGNFKANKYVDIKIQLNNLEYNYTLKSKLTSLAQKYFNIVEHNWDKYCDYDNAQNLSKQLELEVKLSSLEELI